MFDDVERRDFLSAGTEGNTDPDAVPEVTETRCKTGDMEIDPHYCDVVIKRWEDFTGQKAERIPDDEMLR
jgi:hypothetical protein